MLTAYLQLEINISWGAYKHDVVCGCCNQNRFLYLWGTCFVGVLIRLNLELCMSSARWQQQPQLQSHVPFQHLGSSEDTMCIKEYGRLIYLS